MVSVLVSILVSVLYALMLRHLPLINSFLRFDPFLIPDSEFGRLFNF